MHLVNSGLSILFDSLCESSKIIQIKLLIILQGCLHDQCYKFVLIAKEVFSLINFQIKLSSFFVDGSFALRHDLIINLANLSNEQVKHHNQNHVDIHNPESPRKCFYDNTNRNVLSICIIGPFGVIIYLQISN